MTQMLVDIQGLKWIQTKDIVATVRSDDTEKLTESQPSIVKKLVLL